MALNPEHSTTLCGHSINAHESEAVRQLYSWGSGVGGLGTKLKAVMEQKMKGAFFTLVTPCSQKVSSSVEAAV